MSDRGRRPFSLEEHMPGKFGQFILDLAMNRLIPGVFALLRAVAPVVRLPFSKMIVVTRFDDVQEVCNRHDDFPVPYQTMVDHLGWTPTFLLAMKDTPEYHLILGQVRQLWRDDDLLAIRAIAREASQQALMKADGQMDAIQDLMVPVTIAVIERYYGIPITAEQWQPFRDGAMHIAGYLFGPQQLDAKKIDRAQRAITGVWEVIDDAISQAHVTPLPDNTIIGRCHSQQITDDEHLRSYLMGMIVGYLPTNTNANGRVLKVIMANRAVYKAAAAAAEDSNRDELLRIMHEALRLQYILPGLWRTTEKEVFLREDTARPIPIPQGSLLYVSFMSAMRDHRRIKNPGTFDTRRSKDIYMIYGHGFHYCVGDKISDVMMEEIFLAMMQRRPRAVGKMVMRGNFPWHQMISLQDA